MFGCDGLGLPQHPITTSGEIHGQNHVIVDTNLARKKKYQIKFQNHLNLGCTIILENTIIAVQGWAKLNCLIVL